MQQKIENQKLFCITRLKGYPDEYSLILEKGVQPIEIDHLKGFELYAKNEAMENEELYQVILFEEDGGYYIFWGTYLADSPSAASDFRKIILTFKRKK